MRHRASFLTFIAVLGASSLGTAMCQVRQSSPKRKDVPSRIVCVDSKATGSACAEEEFRKKGRPLMLPEEHGIAFGISVPPSELTRVFIWMDNRSDVSQSHLMACNLSYLSSFAVFDAEGNRRLTKTEEERRKSKPSGEIDLNEIEVCSCCVFFSIAPHSMQVVDGGDLLYAYALPAGRYYLAPVRPDEKRPSTQPKDTVEIVISEKK